MLSAGAKAADLPLPMPYQPLPTFAAYNWTGIYAGVQAGYDWSHERLVETATVGGAFVAQYDYHPDGFAGGAHVGANYEFNNNVVLGAEVDFEGSTLRGTFVDPTGIGRGGDTVDWQGSARGRLGYAFDRVLVYATGGLAFADIKNTYVFVPTNTSESFTNVRTGWTVGGGLEYAITDNWIGTVGYRYTQFTKFHNNSVVAFPGSTGTQELTTNMVRLGVSYRF